MMLSIDESAAVGTELDNMLCIVVEAVDARMSLSLAHKIPTIQMIDAYCMTMSKSSVRNGSSCSLASARRNLCGNYGSAHAGSYSSSEAIIS